MIDQQIIEKENNKKSSKKSYKTIQELLTDKEALTLYNPVMIFMLSILFLVFVWFFFDSYGSISISESGGAIIVIGLFGYSLFLSFKNKFKDKIK